MLQAWNNTATNRSSNLFSFPSKKKKCKEQDSVAICWGKEHGPYLATFHCTSSFNWYGRGCRDALTSCYPMCMKYAHVSTGEGVTAKTQRTVTDGTVDSGAQLQNLPNMKEEGLIVTEIKILQTVSDYLTTAGLVYSLPYRQAVAKNAASSNLCTGGYGQLLSGNI